VAGDRCRRLLLGAHLVGLRTDPVRPPRQRDQPGARAVEAGAPRGLPQDGHQV